MNDRSHPAARAGELWESQIWTVVIEFAGCTDRGSCRAEMVEALIDELVVWHPIGMWCPDRYAIQLEIPARGPHRAVHDGLEYHHRARHAVGLGPPSLIRVEVLACEEMTDTEPVAPACVEECSAERYAAIRELVAATAVADVGEIVNRFVTRIGAEVREGPPRHVPTMTEIDLGLSGGATRHASAEALSMAGLCLERVLPDLLVDANRALLRLEGRPGARPVPPGPS